jgi:hypothetical protein
MTPAMRSIFALGLLLFLAACSGDPGSYGITGPGAPPEPVTPSPDTTPDTAPTPGVTTTGPTYGPSGTSGPSTGNSGFWGYN